MKRFLFLMATVVALCASAGNFTGTGNVPLKPQGAIHPDSVKAGDHVNLLRMPGLVNPQSAAAPQFKGTISKRPEGVMKMYKRSGGNAWFIDNSNGWGAYPQEGYAYVIYGDDSKVYLLNPINFFGTQNYEYWVEGTLSEDGTQIIVPLGQTIYYDEFNDMSYVLCWGSNNIFSINSETTEWGEFQWVWCVLALDERMTEVVYTINDGCLYLEGTEGDINDPFPDNFALTGLTAVAWKDGIPYWSGFLDVGTVYYDGRMFNFPKMINEQPEGEQVEYFGYGECVSGGRLREMDQKFSMVYGEGGKVYLKNPVVHMPVCDRYKDYWVEGSLSEDGTTITVPMGQCIDWDWRLGCGIFLKNLTLDYNEDGFYYGNWTYIVNEDITEMTYTIDGDTIYLNGTQGDMNTPWPTVTGLSGVWENDNLEYNEDLEYVSQIMWNTFFRKVVPAVPADPSLDYAETGYICPWEDHGDEYEGSYFLHHIKLEDVDGRPIDADHVSYSIFTDDEPFLFTAWDYAYGPYMNEDTYELAYNLHTPDLWNKRTHFWRTNAEGYKPLFNNRIGIQVYYTVNGVRNASHKIWYYLVPVYAEHGVPENPTADRWYDCGNESGRSRFFYTISKYTADPEHELMDPSRVYYSIFTDDDQIFSFRADDYTRDHLDEDMTLVPYTHDGYDIHNNYSYFYRTNAEGYEPFFNHQIGIQVYYLGTDGEMTATDIVYLEVFEPSTGVNDVAAGKTVAGVRYFNMAGQEMSEAKGICIAVITYTDGTTHAVKIVR